MHLIDQQLDLMVRGRIDEGWKISQKLQEETPNDLRHLFNRGWFLIQQGDFIEGSMCLEAGRHLNVYGSSPLPTSKPIWRFEDLTNKTVIINLEGGLGDHVIHARFATDIRNKGGIPIICCDPSLQTLLSRIEGVEKCIQLSQVPFTDHDYWIPGFSCAWLLGHTFDTLPNKPYLKAKEPNISNWKQIISSDKKKIGIRWSGSPKFEHQQFRVFPPEKLIDIYKNPDIQVYSFQKDNDTRELPEGIDDLNYLLISWEDTAAAISNLDLMITSCTSIAHVSSAMGIPTWVIVPILPYHIWAYGGDHSPWYQKTTKVFRQKEFGNWDQTFIDLNAELVNYISNEKI